MTLSRKFLVALVTISMIISFIIHMPIEVQQYLFDKILLKPVYTDIVDSYYRRVFLDQRVCSAALGNGSLKDSVWVNMDVAKELCRGEPVIPIPYRDYVLEIPPLHGLLWFISTSVSLVLSGYNSMYSEYTDPGLRMFSLTIYYVVMGIMIYLSSILLVLALHSLADSIGAGERRAKLLYLLPLLPSFIVYGVYGLEIIACSFLALSMLMLYRSRYLLAGLFIGLSVTIHLFPLAIVIIVIYELLQHRDYLDHAYRYLVGFTAAFASYLVLVFVNPRVLPRIFIGSGVMCENCIFLYLTGSSTDPLSRSISIVTIVIVVTLVMILYARETNLFNTLYIKSAIAVVALTVFHYIFKPQYLLLITTMLILVLTLREFIYYLLIDLLNSLIILLWFRDQELREILGFLGIGSGYNPLAPDSPIQMIAFTRDILLFILLASLFHKYLSLRKSMVG